MADQTSEKKSRSRASHYLYNDDIERIKQLSIDRTYKERSDVTLSDIVTEALQLLWAKEDRKKAKNKPINKTRRKQ